MCSEPSGELDHLARRVIGAAINVHRELGPGFLETVYEKALAIELEVQHIAHIRQYPVNVLYRDQNVGEGRLDFLIENCLIVELKAVDELHAIHTAQVISYLKATHLKLGLLINFNETALKNGIKRVVYN